jgi:hypothetical protein
LRSMMDRVENSLSYMGMKVTPFQRYIFISRWR